MTMTMGEFRKKTADVPDSWILQVSVHDEEMFPGQLGLDDPKVFNVLGSVYFEDDFDRGNYVEVFGEVLELYLEEHPVP